jgi:hypothetical protein
MSEQHLPTRILLMKLHALIFAVLFCLVPFADAQPATVPEAFNADGSLSLPGGKLSEMVAEIERRLPQWPRRKDGAPWVWPNIVYAPAVINRNTLPLRLRGVEPVEALALIAAAAGCKLEPIFAPKETPEAVGQRVIGYRFEMDATADAGRFGPTPDAAPQDLRPTVRVYSLGASLGGSNEEMEKKTARLHDLIVLAIQKSEPVASRTPPDLAFHAESRTLIAKATPAQHELIDQVVKAVRENETQSESPKR